MNSGYRLKSKMSTLSFCTYCSNTLFPALVINEEGGVVGNNVDLCNLNHSLSVGWYACALAVKMGLKERQLNKIFQAGLFHDVGKIRIPNKILNKKGSLTHSEYLLIQKHPVYSWDILGENGFSSEVLKAVLHHHERYDGTGYPKGLKGEEIPLLSRILAVVDAFDAITRDRPYRQGRCTAFARNEIIKNAGKQFDPEIAGVFLQLLKENCQCFSSWSKPCNKQEDFVTNGNERK